MDNELAPIDVLSEQQQQQQQQQQTAAPEGVLAAQADFEQQIAGEAEATPQAATGLPREEGEDMTKSGSVCFLPKRTISTALECVLSCISFTSLIYIALLGYSLTFSVELDLVFLVIGYISTISLITTPLGIYGSSRGSYCALVTFLVLSSYHLYGLVMYFWFTLKAPLFNDGSGEDASSRLKQRGYESLHYITSSAYLALVALSLLLTKCKIVSLVGQIEPARVIVLDSSAD